MISFEWNREKARSNLGKHGVSFEEASSVFYDDSAVQFFDEESCREDRFILLGVSSRFRIIVLVHCERGAVIRIISARKATRNERKYYQGDTA